MLDEVLSDGLSGCYNQNAPIYSVILISSLIPRPCTAKVLKASPVFGLQAELAKRLVAIEIPDRSQRTALKLKEAEKSVPVPERVWALRNVGATSAMGGREGQIRARSLLERAIQLKEGFVGSAQHPGLTPDACRTQWLLSKQQ